MYVRAGDPESTREPWLDFTWDLTALPAPDAGTGGDGGDQFRPWAAVRLGQPGGVVVVCVDW